MKNQNAYIDDDGTSSLPVTQKDTDAPNGQELTPTAASGKMPSISALHFCMYR